MILVTGATGKVGREVLSELLQGGHKVRGVSRSPQPAVPVGVEMVVGSPGDAASMSNALEGVEAAFVVLVGDVEREAAGFAAAAEAAQLKRAVLLSSSSVVHPVQHRIGEEHRRAEELVTAAVQEVAVLRPGPFHSNALWWSQSIKETGRARCLVGNQAIAPVHPRDVADVAVRLLLDPEMVPGAYEITGDELITSADQIAVLAELLGRPVGLDVATADEAVDIFARIGGDREAAVTNVAALRSPSVPWGTTTPTVQRLLSRSPRSFRSWAEENVAAFS